MKLLKILGVIVLVVLLIPVLYLGGMRFADGPSGIVTGGPFRSGELTPSPRDWSFIKGRSEIEFQTLEPEASRVVWLGVLEGRLYIISGYMNTTTGKVWKRWPYHLQDDDRVILRIDGKLYEQRLERLMAHPKLVELMTIYQEKYGAGGTDEAQLTRALQAGDFWLYEVVDR